MTMTTHNLNDLIQALFNTFIQRRDLYARQLDNGSYVCVQKPLLPKHVAVHIQGKMTLGVYVLDKTSQTRFIVFDADDDTQLEQLMKASQHNPTSRNAVPRGIAWR